MQRVYSQQEVLHQETANPPQVNDAQAEDGEEDSQEEQENEDVDENPEEVELPQQDPLTVTKSGRAVKLPQHFRIMLWTFNETFII